jgi:aminoglycoside phosphotransferase (APT) family kinase protein
VVDPRHGWLAAALPGDAHRFRVVHHSLAATLADAGAELVDARPDVEVAPAEALRGDASCALVVFDAGGVAASRSVEGRSRVLRVALRAGQALRVRLRARSAATALGARGYERVRTIFWEPEQPLSLGRSAVRTSLRGLVPLGAAVIGERGPEVASLLQRAAAEATDLTGRAVLLDRLRTASWGILALGDSAVLRVTVGPGRGLLDAQEAALAELRPRAATLERLVPWPLARGRSGIADWLVEPRLPGTPAAGVPDERLLNSALDVLAALHASGEPREGAGSPAADAAALLAAVPQELAQGLRDLGSRLESRLADLPRSFAHGDFSSGNLLFRGRELSGVVDWNKAGQGRLPLLDLLNLLLTIEVTRSRRNHGDAFVDHLLPWARAGGDERTRAFCSRISLDVGEGLLEDLAAAWWLDRHAHQVKTYSDRLKRPAWLRENVERPLRALVQS